MNLRNLQKIAKKTLHLEAEAINAAAERIDSSFEECVKSILQAKGRVVVTGIGKSANIGSKIVATLSSTGTPALFMHAADAIHGDLGMIQPDDCVLCISNSGNTPEIKVLVPLLKEVGSKLIALVGNVNSFLAKQADFVLDATIEKEADPNNLAPTTSTTVALALGDALAVCLLSARNFDSNDFARLHPGGALGKQLYLKVGDLYVNHDLPQVSKTDTLEKVIFEISNKRLGATTVVDQNGVLEGIITDGDIRRVFSKSLAGETIFAQDIMGSSPKVILSDAYAVEALQLMRENNIMQLVVVDSNNKALGIIHLHDLLKEGIV